MSISASPSARRVLQPVPANLVFQHRGFGLTVCRQQGRYGATSFGYTIRHIGHILHQSDAEFGSAEAADRAARRFVDDALGAFGFACEHIDATC